MKRVPLSKIVALLLAALLLLALVGCSKPGPGLPGASTNAPEALTDAPAITTDEPAEAPTAVPERTASAETAELARTAVEKLEQAVVFSLSYGISTEKMYEAGLSEAPELAELEAKDDASAALAELYSDVLSELREFDLDAYYAWCMETLSDPEPELTDDFLRGRALLGEREAIEALLALDRYYDKLTAEQLERLKAEFNAAAELIFTAEAKAFPDAVRSVPPFYRYREVRFSAGTFGD